MHYNISTPIYIRDDGTYEITLNGMPYHATGLEKHGQKSELIEAIKTYCEENGITPGAKPIEIFVPTAESVRAERDAKIKSVRWRVERYNDEVAMGSTPTEKIEPIYAYIQALRDVPEQKGFPEKVKWPKEV